MPKRFDCLATKLSLSVDGTPPTEFPIFASGWNETEKGSFLFDAEAAEAVMASYNSHDVDRMIDLEHLSIDSDSPNYDPDARGWFNLELRPDGSLWAVNVTWTADGAARLSEKRQRYISPAFATDPKTKRPTKILNVAITALPATHNTPALVAASDTGSNSMTIEEFLKVTKALGIDGSSSMEEAMAKIKGEEKPKEEPKPEEPAAATAVAPAPEEEKPAAALADDSEEVEASTTLSLMIARFTGKNTAAEQVKALNAFETARAAREAEERREFCVELVTLGAEFPSTVWADDKSKTLKPRWQTMSIDELRTHVKEQRVARKGQTKTEIKPPAGGPVVELSARELNMCAEMNIKPEEYAARKAQKKG